METNSSQVAVLIDHNLQGHARLLWKLLETEGWLKLYPLKMVMFEDVGLVRNANDRDIWRFTQANNLILLTGNRNMEGQDSLEQTMREENSITSLPIITISRIDGLSESGYRKRCAERLMEIMFDLENYLGAGRIFIP